MDIEEGELIFPIGAVIGRYRIDALIGVGGMGQVYRAFHMDLEEDFALKAIRKDFISSATEVERFKREAQTAHRLKHPNIVPIDDFNLHNDICYLRMAYFPGIEVKGKRAVSLDQYLRLMGEPLSIEKARKWLLDIANGLRHAHMNGVIHRDLKPSNILLNDGMAMIADFGLVRIVGEDFLKTRVRLSVYKSQVVARDTSSGRSKLNSSSDAAMVGTYEFMAPEIKDGMDADERSDLYAVGLIALYMLTGRSSICVGLPSSNYKWIPLIWDGFFQRTLTNDPKDRFADVDEAIQWLQNPGHRKRRMRRGRRGPRRKSRNRVGNLRGLVKTGAIIGAFIAVLFILNKFFVLNDGNRFWALLFRSEKPTIPVMLASEGPAEIPSSVDSVALSSANEKLLKEFDEQPSFAQEKETNEVATEEYSEPTSRSYTRVSVSEGVEVPNEEPFISEPVAPGAGIGQTEQVLRPGTVPQESLSAGQNSKLGKLSINLGPAAPAIEFLRVEPGSSPYGSDADEIGRTPSEENLKIIEIEKPFYLSTYEVTREQYKALTGRDPSRYNGANMPVNNISGDDIRVFIEKLNTRLRELGTDHLKARLPSQKEWEYVARAARGGAYGGLPGDAAKGENLEMFAHFDSSRGPLPVGSLKPNVWGFHDMYGNVEEVTQNGFIRGGNFSSSPGEIRSAYVRPLGESFPKDDRIGFRLALD